MSHKFSIKMPSFSHILVAAITFDLLFCLAGINSATAQQDVAGSSGWYKTKWGMTAEEVSATLGDSIIPLSQQDRKRFPDFEYTMSDFQIGKYSFEVYFAFASVGLNKVMVRKKGQGEYYACFLHLEDSLKKKYGSPSDVKDDDRKRDAQSHTREWLTQGSIIALNNVTLWIGGKPYETTNVIYSSRRTLDAAGDKL